MGGKNIFALQALDLRDVRSQITRPANTTAYAAGDSVSDATGDAHFSWEIRSANELGKAQGEIKMVRFTSSGTVATALDSLLHIFKEDVGVDADNVPLTLTDAEWLTRVGTVALASGSVHVGQNSSGLEVFPDLPFTGAKTLYGVLEARNAYVPESAEIITLDLVIARY